MEKFKLSKTKGATNKTIRIPNDTIDKIDAYVKKNNSTFTDFILSAIDFAFKSIEENKSK